MEQETPLTFVVNRKLFYIFFIAIISFLVFSNTFKNGFHLDDANSIVGNPAIRKITPLLRYFTDVSVLGTYAPNRQFRPFLPLTISLNYAIGAYDTVSYHLFNLIFNAISAILIFFIFIEIQRQAFPSGDQAGQMDIAFASSVLFAVHPVSGITINYISNRDLVLMQMFLSASFLVYVKMRRTKETVLGYVFAALMLACSMLSKTNPVVMPLLILSYEVLVMKGKYTDPKTWLRTLPFGIVVLSFFAYTKFFINFSDVQHLFSFDRASLFYYFPTQARLHLFVYLANFFYPFNIHIEPYVERVGILNLQAITGILFIAGSLFAAVKARQKNPVLSFCVMAYWIMLLPDSSFMPLHEWMVDYRPYPSSPYLYFLLATAACVYLKPRLRNILFIAFLAYFSVSSFFINRLWVDGNSLWAYSIKKGANPIAYQNLALYSTDLYEKKQYLEKALAISPYYLFPNINYAVTLIKIGARKKGLDTMKRTVELDPNNPITHIWSSKLYEMLNMKKEALDEAVIAARLDPQDVEYAYSAALLAEAQGDFALALENTASILKLYPDFEDTYFVQGFALQKLGRIDECIPAYRAALKKNKIHYQAWFNLGFALKDKGLYKEAIECFNKVLDLKSDYDETRWNLEFCYNKIGDHLSDDFEKLVLRNK